MKNQMLMLVVLSFTLVFLVFTGCQSEESRIAEQFCERYADCSPSVFEETFSTMEDCIEQERAWYEFYLNQGGEECRQAYIDRQECLGNLQSCDPPAGFCRAEFEQEEILCFGS
ncbi:MAG: hypothetical protein ABI333_09780 [bacterium]